MEVAVTVLLIVVVLGFALAVFSGIAGGFLHRTGVRGKNSTAEQWYGRFDDDSRRR